MDEETERHWERYLKNCHAIQTAIAYAITVHGDASAGVTPKHLRVGIDTQKVELGAITKLLVAKGILTDLEVAKAMADAMEQEKETREEQLGVKLF